MHYSLAATIVHLGLMDGSAGVAVSENEFITVSDEVNHLKRFAVVGGAEGKMALDLNGEKGWFPAREKKEKGRWHEADIEGAARVGDVVYWISSHGWDDEKEEKARDHRVFFATKIGADGSIMPHGKVYTGLLDDLLAETALVKYGLEAASKKMPKAEGGLNIESLCTAADGKTLLIGFRNPITEGKALIVPLENPEALVSGGVRATFGKPIEVKLGDAGGLGLRDMVWWRGGYLLIGGYRDSHFGKDGKPKSDAPASALFRWDGKSPTAAKYEGLDFNLLNPECLILFPNDRVLILSDDGEVLNEHGVSQKDAWKSDPVKFPGTFRSVWLEGQE